MPILPDTFCVFILTHGRPDSVVTLKTLGRCGYTGRIYLVVDDEDKTVDRYRQNFGAERVIVFDKKAEADACDEGNNFDERRTITMARNACFGIAERLGVIYFVELDDEYTDFRYKLEETGNHLAIVKQLDEVFAKMLRFFIDSGSTSVAFAQNGDFIGGFDNDAGRSQLQSAAASIACGRVARSGSSECRQGAPDIRGTRYYRFSKRKCMNTFFCSTERPFRFVGAMNEDVNTYTTLGSRGSIFLTVPFVAINQTATQSQSGGITAMYKRFGTYCKAFTTVMMMPSAVRVGMMASKTPRIHHMIDWGRAVPRIVSDQNQLTDEQRAEAGKRLAARRGAQ
jgi:hypothetical protein